MSRRIEGNFNQGWGFAALVTLMVIAGFATAYTMKQRTWHSPNDVTAPTSEGASHAPAASR